MIFLENLKGWAKDGFALQEEHPCKFSLRLHFASAAFLQRWCLQFILIHGVLFFLRNKGRKQQHLKCYFSTVSRLFGQKRGSWCFLAPPGSPRWRTAPAPAGDTRGARPSRLVPLAAPTGADFPSFGPVFWEIRATAGPWRLLWVPRLLLWVCICSASLRNPRRIMRFLIPG